MEPFLSILAVEDEPIIRLMLQTYFRRAGEHFKVAADGDEAKKLIAQEEFNLLLTDFHFPAGDGNEIAKLFREKNDNSFVIGMSGHHINMFNPELVSLTIEKPFSITQLDDSLALAREFVRQHDEKAK